MDKYYNPANYTTKEAMFTYKRKRRICSIIEEENSIKRIKDLLHLVECSLKRVHNFIYAVSSDSGDDVAGKYLAIKTKIILKSDGATATAWLINNTKNSGTTDSDKIWKNMELT